MAIDFEVEIEQTEDRNFKLELSLEGAFLSEKILRKKILNSL